MYLRITLYRDMGDKVNEAVSHRELSRLLAYRGLWHEAEAALETAQVIRQWRWYMQGVGINWAYRAQLSLLAARDARHLITTDLLPQPTAEALYAAQRALALAEDTAISGFPYPRDFVRAHWLMGAAHRSAGNHDEAALHLDEALARCHAINLVEFEADILFDLARLSAARGDSDGSPMQYAEEALQIAERSGYVLQLADIHLFLAEQALARNDRATALHHATEAKQYAHCDDGPPWHYKVAYDEATALLARLGGERQG